jgi:hypothetical protein
MASRGCDRRRRGGPAATDPMLGILPTRTEDSSLLGTAGLVILIVTGILYATRPPRSNA